MENSRPQPGESNDENTQQSVGSKRRSSDFLSYYQRLLGRRPGLEDVLNPTEREDDEEEYAEKPKKWRGFFRRLFGSVVTPPDGEEKAEGQHGFNPDAWYVWQTASAAKATDTIAIESPVVSTELPETIIDATTEAPPLTTAVSELTPTAELPQQNEESLSEPLAEQTEVLVHQSDRPTDQEQTQTPHQTSEHTRERVIERGVGGGLPLLLVGAEYLGRKRADKQIRKEFTQNLDTMQQKAAQQETSTTQLHNLIEQNKQQLETLKRERGMVNAQEPRPAQSSVEVNTNLTPPEEQVSTSRILESVADAAEHNVAVERIFERSHEVKDEQGSTNLGSDSGASSVGAVMAAQLAQLQTTSGNPVRTNTNEGLPVINEQTAKDMYARAMRSGFMAAVMLIILGLLAYLVIQ